MGYELFAANKTQFYELKSTKPGLETMLLIFGIVGKVITMWTEADNPYGEFVEDFRVKEVQYQFVCTGH